MKRLELKGQKFGKLTVLDYAGTSSIHKKPRSLWQCLCDCGKQVFVIGTNLKKGNSNSCGCVFLNSKKYNFKDLVGQKFGQLEVIKRLEEKTKTRGVLWGCKCACGAMVNLPSNSLTSGNTLTCGDRSKHDLVTKHGDLPDAHVNQIKQNAIKRNLTFNVSPSYLWELFLKQNRTCALSGVEIFFSESFSPSKRSKGTASLDRIDSKQGYVEGNVRWVHKDVNRIRWELDDETFLSWCRSCFNYSGRKNNTSQPSWEETFFRDVYNYAARSKDPRTKIGAVLVDWESKNSFSHGYNGFPRKVSDLPERWNNRDIKYEFVVHAEENCILNCARHGNPTKGAVMLTNGIPCASCAKAVCNAGIKEIIVHKQWQDYERKFNWDKWVKSAEISQEMFREAGVGIRVFDKFLGIPAHLDGKVIEV
jgi:dCMP deaminase